MILAFSNAMVYVIKRFQWESDFTLRECGEQTTHRRYLYENSVHLICTADQPGKKCNTSNTLVV